MLQPFLISALTIGPIIFFASRPAIGSAQAARMALLMVGGLAAFLWVQELAPEPYDDLLPVFAIALLLGVAAVGQWRASRHAAASPRVHTLRRTHYQRHALWLAAFLAAVLTWSLVDDMRAGHLSPSVMDLLALGIIVSQLLAGLPTGSITESGILVHGRLYRWSTLHNLEWLHGEPATLAYTVQKAGRVEKGKLKLHPGDVAPVTDALTRFAGYSPVTGS